MPRLSKRPETLTPKMERILPFLTCFFDLPLKSVLQLLNVSHHTLDPIRRSMGLKKWPFVDIVRGQYCQREDIVAMRAEMMPVADTEMQRLICRAATRSEEFWTNSSKRIERTRKRKPCASNSHAPPDFAGQELSHDAPAQEESFQASNPSVWPEDEQEEGSSFWNDMRDLFELGQRAAVTAEPWSEHGLFSQ